MGTRFRFEVGWQDWAVAIALGALVLLLAMLALITWGGWSHQRDVARAMEPPRAEGPDHPPAPSEAGEVQPPMTGPSAARMPANLATDARR